MKELLPVGSIVKLKNNKEYMIIGFYPCKPNSKNQYEYIVCESKKGLKNTSEKLEPKEDYFYLKKEQITEVLFIGFSDFEFDFYTRLSNELITNLEKEKKKNDKLEKKDLIKIYSDIIDEYVKEDKK